MLNVSSYNRGSGFRAQCDQITFAIGEGIHLFFDNIRIFTDAAFKKLCALHDRYPDFFKPEIFKQLAGNSFDFLPLFHFSGKYIFKASDELYHDLQSAFVVRLSLDHPP